MSDFLLFEWEISTFFHQGNNDVDDNIYVFYTDESFF